MGKVSFLYGMISSGIATILFLLIYLMMGDVTVENFKLREYLGYATIFISLTMIYFGTKNFRDNELNGTISYGKAFGTGLLISIFSALGFGLFIFILMSVIDPNFTDRFYEVYRQMIEASAELTDEKKSMALKQLEGMKDWVYSPLWQGLVMFFTVFLMGLILSLINGIIVKRRNT